jgi:hypothetical protein
VKAVVAAAEAAAKFESLFIARWAESNHQVFFYLPYIDKFRYKEIKR